MNASSSTVLVWRHRIDIFTKDDLINESVRDRGVCGAAPGIAQVF